MEKIGQDPKPSFNSLNSPNREIRIGLGSVEENIRKLYEATKMGCVQTLNTLLQEDPNLIQKAFISSSNNDTPLLHISICNGHLEFTRLLLHHSPELVAEVDAFGRTPLHLASKHGYLDAIEALLENNISRSACLAYDKDGLIPLHYGVIGGHVEVMQRLINARPQSIWMNPKNNHGGTILHLCVESNHFEGIKLLLETFTNHVDEYFLNTTDDKGNTILDLSFMLRQSEMVAYLLSIPEVKTSANSTGKEISAEEESEKMTRRRRRRRTKAGWPGGVLKKKMKYKGNWVDDVEGTIMLVATVIATVTFQAGLNPPGGLWQQDTPYNGNNTLITGHYYPNLSAIITPYSKFSNGTTNFLAGTPIMAYQQRPLYFLFSNVNMMSFMASVTTIMLIISRLPLNNRVCSWMLISDMFMAVVFLGFGYLLGFLMVHNSLYGDITFAGTYVMTLLLFSGLVGLVVLYHLIRFLIWVLKALFRTFISIFKCIVPS